MIYKAFAILALLAVPLGAVDVLSIVLDTVADTLTVTRTNGQVKVYSYASFLPLDAADLAAARDEVQEELYDEVIQRNQLPNDDPDRQSDPNNECAHWTGPGQRIVYRNTIVVSVLTDTNGDPYLELRNCDSSLPPLP